MPLNQLFQFFQINHSQSINSQLDIFGQIIVEPGRVFFGSLNRIVNMIAQLSFPPQCRYSGQRLTN